MLQLSSFEERLLLKIARRSVEGYLSKATPDPIEVPEGPLREPYGVFVSIHKGDQLRGCIGRIQPTEALSRTAGECAVSAAVGDPRFLPVGSAELAELKFEISVLSPPERIAEDGEIEIGRHGLLIERGDRHGLLLPQVATQQGWDRCEFLRQTAIKAGMEPDAWKSDAAIFRFEALVFEEAAEEDSR